MNLYDNFKVIGVRKVPQLTLNTTHSSQFDANHRGGKMLLSTSALVFLSLISMVVRVDGAIARHQGNLSDTSKPMDKSTLESDPDEDGRVGAGRGPGGVWESLAGGVGCLTNRECGGAPVLTYCRTAATRRGGLLVVEGRCGPAGYPLAILASVLVAFTSLGAYSCYARARGRQ